MPILTPTLSLCDELVSVIGAAWSPAGNDAVSREYAVRVVAKDLTGRKVWVFPSDYEFAPANRGEDEIGHRVTAVVAERYTGPGLPDNDWLDERADFVFTRIVQGLWFGHDGPHVFGDRSVYTSRADAQVCDLEKLTTTPAVFWAVVELEFQELIAAP